MSIPRAGVAVVAVSANAAPAYYTAILSARVPVTPGETMTAAATTNAAVVSSAGNLFTLTASNPTATPCYVKLYNKTTAPTVGTDVPVMTIPVPATSFQKVDLGQIGHRFTSGISIAVTAGPLANDTAAAVAGVQIMATYR